MSQFNLANFELERSFGIGSVQQQVEQRVNCLKIEGKTLLTKEQVARVLPDLMIPEEEHQNFSSVEVEHVGDGLYRVLILETLNKRIDIFNMNAINNIDCNCED